MSMHPARLGQLRAIESSLREIKEEIEHEAKQHPRYGHKGLLLAPVRSHARMAEAAVGHLISTIETVRMALNSTEDS